MSGGPAGPAALEPLRTQIEALDRELVGLIAERVRLARAAGRAKRAAGLPTLDPSREAAVVRRAGALAREAGLADEAVRDVFWQLIGLCRRAQAAEEEPESEEARLTNVGGRDDPLPAAPGCVAVLGLGLIGGSLARELAARGARVLGYDRDAAAVEALRAAGVLHAALGPALAGLEAAETVVLAVPVSAAPALLAAAAPRLAAARLVTDVSSTQRAIVATAERLGLAERFVGAHPLAGDHRSGWTASRIGLFRGARVYLCPAAGAGEAALCRARRLWTALGAAPELLDAAEHDRRLAWTSHLPQAVASALALALAEAGIAPAELGPGGRDMTRLAGSSPELWTGIALENRDTLGTALTTLEAHLRALRQGLGRADAGIVRSHFERGRRWREECQVCGAAEE